MSRDVEKWKWTNETQHNMHRQSDIVDQVKEFSSVVIWKERRNHKSFLWFHMCVCVPCPCACASICVRVSIAFVRNFSLCYAHCTLWIDWNWREKKMFFGLSPCPFAFVSQTRNVKQFQISSLVESWWSTCQFTVYIFTDYFDNGQNICMLSIILIFMRFACTTATLWRRLGHRQQQFQMKRAVQFN